MNGFCLEYPKSHMPHQHALNVWDVADDSNCKPPLGSHADCQEASWFYSVSVNHILHP